MAAVTTIPEPTYAKWSRTRSKKTRERKRKFGPLEERVLSLCKDQGTIRPRELHDLRIKNPERILSRLTSDGVLVRIARGLYELPIPARERIEAARAHQAVIVTAKHGGHVAPNAVPARGIKKGAALALAEPNAAIFPGDVVLVARSSAPTIQFIGVLVEIAAPPAIGEPGKEQPPVIYKIATDSAAPSRSYGAAETITRKIVGAMMRKTQKAAAERAKQPAPPIPSDALWFTPQETP